ncbi:hypothetical protein ACFL0W_05145 [Nanoarchaeota archaeon]
MIKVPFSIKKSFQKKAEVSSSVKYSLLFVIALVVFSMFFVQYIHSAEEFVADTRCQQSVLQNAFRLRIMGTDLSDKMGNIIPIQCKTDYPKPFPKSDEQEYKKIIANNMLSCWNTFLRGQKELFAVEDQNFCVVCSRLEFEEKTKLPEFTKFLIETKAPPFFNETYFEIFRQKKTEKGILKEYENSQLKGKEAMDLSKPLAVVYILGKDAHIGKGDATTIGAGGAVILVGIGSVLTVSGIFAPIGLTVIAGIAGGASGYMLGSDYSADYNARVMVWPYDDLSALKCTRLEGRSGYLSLE